MVEATKGCPRNELEINKTQKGNGKETLFFGLPVFLPQILKIPLLLKPLRYDRQLASRGYFFFLLLEIASDNFPNIPSQWSKIPLLCVSPSG